MSQAAQSPATSRQIRTCDMRSWLERSISYVAPQWGLKRARAVVAADFILRHYEAAATGRRTQGERHPGRGLGRRPKAEPGEHQGRRIVEGMGREHGLRRRRAE